MQFKIRKYQYKHFSYVVLALMAIFVYGKDYLYFDNGAGGVNWKIGKPQVNLLSAIPQRSLPELRQQALILINRDRQLNGLPPLIEDPLITLTAQKHAEDMAKRHFYAHINPEGQNPTDRYQFKGGKGGIGENITYLEKSPGITLTYGLLERFQRSWMYSEGHRQNLLNPNYTKFGFGIAVNSITGEAYGVQNFQ